jgi:two-component system OmpR family response regulator
VPWCVVEIVLAAPFAGERSGTGSHHAWVQRQGRQIDVSPKELSLLELLMRHAGQPVSRPAIVEQVWKLNCDTMTNVVDVYINYLRRKMDVGFEVSLIRTIRGVGYQIGANVAPV